MSDKDLSKENQPSIDEMMASLSIEKAPASLTRRLYRIPEEYGAQKKRRWFDWPVLNPMPRWALAPAFAAVPLLVLTAVLLHDPGPSEAEIEQARQDLAVAFSYIDKVGNRTGSEIQSVLGGELRHTVKGNLSRHIPFTKQSLEEETT